MTSLRLRHGSSRRAFDNVSRQPYTRDHDVRGLEQRCDGEVGRRSRFLATPVCRWYLRNTTMTAQFASVLFVCRKCVQGGNARQPPGPPQHGASGSCCPCSWPGAAAADGSGAGPTCRTPGRRSCRCRNTGACCCPGAFWVADARRTCQCPSHPFGIHKCCCIGLKALGAYFKQLTTCLPAQAAECELQTSKSGLQWCEVEQGSGDPPVQGARIRQEEAPWGAVCRWFRRSTAPLPASHRAASHLLHALHLPSDLPRCTVDRAHYRGTLASGAVFDSSYERGRPLIFQVRSPTCACICTHAVAVACRPCYACSSGSDGFSSSGPPCHGLS